MARVIFVLLAVGIFTQTDASHQTFGCIPTVSDSAKALPESNCKPCFRGDSEPGNEIVNKWPDVTDLELDKNEIRLPPQRVGSSPRGQESLREMSVTVKTTAQDPEGDVLTYNYTASGGRIIGTGRNVWWDLNGVRPGNYTITAAVDDGCGLCGTKVTKEVVVLEGETLPPCACADISISLSSLEFPDPLEFLLTAQLSGNVPKYPTYNWTISEGILVAGQGTPNIRVRRTSKEHGAQPATATVEIGGFDSDCSCPTSASRSY